MIKQKLSALIDLTFNSSYKWVEYLVGLSYSLNGSLYNVASKTATGSIPCFLKNGC